ncbi:MAG: VOC family protein [Clostridiales bacterium]|nr:VOC family protein [Clostridiales bacterium]
MRIHHIGYLVKNIAKARGPFEELGYEAEGEVVYDPLRDIDILFMVNGDYRIELVQPKSPESVVANTLKKIGNSPYHICYYCDDISKAQIELHEKGYYPLGDIEPAVAIGGRKVCFMLNPAIGMIELVEET